MNEQKISLQKSLEDELHQCKQKIQDLEIERDLLKSRDLNVFIEGQNEAANTQIIRGVFQQSISNY